MILFQFSVLVFVSSCVVTDRSWSSFFLRFFIFWLSCIKNRITCLLSTVHCPFQDSGLILFSTLLAYFFPKVVFWEHVEFSRWKWSFQIWNCGDYPERHDVWRIELEEAADTLFLTQDYCTAKRSCQYTISDVELLSGSKKPLCLTAQYCMILI